MDIASILGIFLVEMIYPLLALVGMTIIYRIVPYKKWTDTKPKLVLLPKYQANFSCPVDHIISNLEQQNFQPKESSVDTYTRGTIWGMRGSTMKLDVHINRDAKSIQIYTSSMLILFDTSDTWKITSAILNNTVAD